MHHHLIFLFFFLESDFFLASDFFLLFIFFFDIFLSLISLLLTLKHSCENNPEKRKEVAEKIRSKYPDRIPVIVQKAPKSNIADIDKKKLVAFLFSFPGITNFFTSNRFLVPASIEVAKFTAEIRKHIKLTSEQGIYLFVKDEKMPQAKEMMLHIYDKWVTTPFLSRNLIG